MNGPFHTLHRALWMRSAQYRRWHLRRTLRRIAPALTSLMVVANMNLCEYGDGEPRVFGSPRCAFHETRVVR